MMHGLVLTKKLILSTSSKTHALQVTVKMMKYVIVRTADEKELSGWGSETSLIIVSPKFMKHFQSGVVQFARGFTPLRWLHSSSCVGTESAVLSVDSRHTNVNNLLICGCYGRSEIQLFYQIFAFICDSYI